MNWTDISEDHIKDIADYEAILQRGLDYHESGRVLSLVMNGNTSRAVVGGNYGNYNVEMSLIDDEIEAFCDCPFDGYGCKHIVAVLYKLFYEFCDEKSRDDAGIRVRKYDIVKGLSTLKDDEMKEIIERICARDDELRMEVLLRLNDGPEPDREAMMIFRDRSNLIISGPGPYMGFEEVNITVRSLQNLVEGIGKADPSFRKEALEYLIEKCTDIGMEIDDSYGIMNEFINEMLAGLGRSIKQMDLSSGERKEVMVQYLERIIKDYQGLKRGYGELVMEIPSSEDEVLFLIDELKKRDGKIFSQMLMDTYEREGFKEEYRHMLEEEASLSGFFSPLVNYHFREGNVEVAVGIAENELKKGKKGFEQIGLMRSLIDHYSSVQRRDDTLRIMTEKCIRFGVTYEEFKEIRKIATRVGKWKEMEKDILFRLDDEDTLMVHLDEKRYDHAYDLLMEKWADITDDLKKKMACTIEDEDPNRSLSIFIKLMNDQIQRKNRMAYRIALHYAGNVKRIMESNGKANEWKSFILDLRRKHAKKKALMEEFEGL